MQKNLIIGIVAVIVIIGGFVFLQRDTEEPAPELPLEDTAATVEEQLTEEPEIPEVAADDDGEATVVEESAAEPEEDEQAILLAQADVPAASYDWKFDEGRHYKRLVPTQPTWGGADKVEVAEFFWYGCPHCYSAEPIINGWVENDMPANARFVRVPAMWNNILVLHARMFFTEQILARNGTIEDPEGFRATVFQEYHQRNNRLSTEASILRLFERFGVSEDDFNKAWNSFEVDQNLRKADDLARRYAVSSVPAIVVNGKYRTLAQEAGGYQQWMELIDELIVRESAR